MPVGPSDEGRSASRARRRGTAVAGRARDCSAWGRCRSCCHSAGPAVDRRTRAGSSGEADTVLGTGNLHRHFDSDQAHALHRGVLQSSCPDQHNRGRQLDQPCPSREPGGSWRTGPLRRPRRPFPRVLAVDVAHYAPPRVGRKCSAGVITQDRDYAHIIRLASQRGRGRRRFLFSFSLRETP